MRVCHFATRPRSEGERSRSGHPPVSSIFVPLSRFEKRLERMVEGAFSRVFRSELRPVEIGRRIVREMDLGLTVGVKGERVAPNEFAVRISPPDLARMDPFAEALVGELDESVEEHAAKEHYTLKGPAKVDLHGDPGLGPGDLRVLGTIRPGPRPTKATQWLVLGDGSHVALRDDDPITIGRTPDCDIVLVDPNVSRRHAEVRAEHDHAVVVDLESLNGTKVNGRGVPRGNRGLVLSAGDVIQVAGALFRYQSSQARA